MHSRKNQQFFGHEKLVLPSLGFEPGTSQLLCSKLEVVGSNPTQSNIANFSYCVQYCSIKFEFKRENSSENSNFLQNCYQISKLVLFWFNDKSANFRIHNFNALRSRLAFHLRPELIRRPRLLTLRKQVNKEEKRLQHVV